jgi:putative membrane protein
MAGALAAALCIAPAAADDRKASDKAEDTAASAKSSAQDTAGKAGDKVSGAASDTKRAVTGAAATTGSKAKAMGKQATSGAARTLAKLHAGNEMEVKAGTWMKEHASDAKVKEFASKMVDDHGKMDEDVMAFAKGTSIDLTSAPKPADVKKSGEQSKLDKLEKMQGAKADSEYMRMMVEDHQKDVKEVRDATTKAKKSGDDKLVTLLGDAGQKMAAHLKDAQDVQKSLQQPQARTAQGSDSGTGSSAPSSTGSTAAPSSTDSTGSAAWLSAVDIAISLDNRLWISAQHLMWQSP